MAAWENNEDDGLSACPENGSILELVELSDPELFESLLGSTDEKISRTMKEAFIGVLADYCNNSKSKEVTVADVERMSPGELCQFLQEFYADVRQPDGRRYTRRLMLALRHVLRNHLQNVLRADIVNDTTFAPANDAFEAIEYDYEATEFQQAPAWKGWERKKRERNVHIISKEDMDKIRSSFLTDCSSPKGLQNTVFLNVMLHFCCTTYGRWNLRDMKKSNFAVMTDGAVNRRFVCFVNKDKMNNLAEAHLGNRDTDNGEGDESDEDFSIEKVRMYEALEDPKHCPVALFEKYLAKLDPKCDVFWQRPHKYKRHDNYWYDGVAVGVNCLGYKMRDISTLAGCSMVYSNQCLKVTSRACRLRMSEIGSPCTCSAQHLLPPDTGENSDSSFQGNRASFCTGSSEEENSFLSFIKDEPDDVIILEDEIDEGHEMHSDTPAQSGSHLSLPKHSGYTSQSGIIYKSAEHPSPPPPPPPASNAFPIQNREQVLPDYVISVKTNDSPQAHQIKEQFGKNQNSRDCQDAWRVEKSWLDENNERKWMLTQKTENKQKKWLLSQNSRSHVEQGITRGSADEHHQRNPPSTHGFLIQTTQNNQPNLSIMEDRVRRSNHAVPQPITGVQAGQNLGTPDSRDGVKSVTPAPWDAPAASSGSGRITTITTADSEVMELQKEVLRMQRANLALERRKMELEISKLEAETLRMRGGS